MRQVLASHRRRRRLLWAAGVLAAAGVLTALAVAFPNRTPRRPELVSNAPARLPEPAPPTVAVSPAARAAALKTAGDFVKTAVLRRHVDASWPLVGPSLRKGYTRREWARGDIPVVPYPVGTLRSARWRVEHSYRNDLGLQVLLLPGAGSRVRPMSFTIGLEAVGGPSRRHWLVESWTPSSVVPPAPSSTPSSAYAVRPVYKPGAKGPLGAAWLLIPGGLLLLSLLVPVGILLRAWWSSRRAERLYEAARLR